MTEKSIAGHWSRPEVINFVAVWVIRRMVQPGLRDRKETSNLTSPVPAKTYIGCSRLSTGQRYWLSCQVNQGTSLITLAW